MYRFDEMISRLFTAFMTPVLNVMLISLLISTSLAPHASLATVLPDIDQVGLAGYTIGAIKVLLSSKVDLWTELAEKNGGNIISLSGRLAVVLIVIFSVAIYLLDQALYFIGWIAPFHVDFDFAAYGRANRGDPRLRKTYAVLQAALPFHEAYGVVVAYLGATNTDAARLKQREARVKAVESARRHLWYMRAYVVLTLLMLAYALVFGVFKPVVVLGWFAVSAVVCALYAVRYSYLSRSLIEFDLDCFTWLRQFDREQGKFVSLGDFDTEFLAQAPQRSRVGMSRIHLRFLPSGYYRAARALAGLKSARDDDNAPLPA